MRKEGLIPPGIQKLLSNWVICFGIHLDSCIITFFFPVLLNHSCQQTNILQYLPLKKKKKVYLWSQITSSLSDFSASVQRKIQKLIILTVSTFSPPIFFPSGFIPTLYPEKLFSLLLPNPMFHWLTALIDLGLLIVIARVGQSLLPTETHSLLDCPLLTWLWPL